MGAIKDIVDLCIKLRDENKDGKITAALGQIQSLTLALQSEQIKIVEKNQELVMENLDLKRKVFDLETSHAEEMAEIREIHTAEIETIKASHVQPKADELEPQSREILKCFFIQACEITDSQIATRFGISLSMAAYHTDTLLRKRFIIQTTAGFNPGSAAYELTGAGRQYVVKNGLAT